jgi:hypothetical protein
MPDAYIIRAFAMAVCTLGNTRRRFAQAQRARHSEQKPRDCATAFACYLSDFICGKRERCSSSKMDALLRIYISLAGTSGW